ncbi:hypothetical protein Hanom_Chr01g00062351 [Helianthus anomalus]
MFVWCTKVRTSVIWSRMMGQNIPSRKPRERDVISDMTREARLPTKIHESKKIDRHMYIMICT